jgi:1,4-alpha-glucan branching enzyme
LCGDFNGWSPDATVMQRRNDGNWEVCLSLGPGRYQYKYLVDGQWRHDPAAKENAKNEFGSFNSIVEVGG